jgi:hypothetical protein
MSDTTAEIARDIEAIGRIEALPTLLKMLLDATGLGFAAVARVSENNWTACAVQDGIQFGLKAGSELDVKTTFCIESRAARAPIVIDQASSDPRYCDHEAAKLYCIESYVCVPIILEDGHYFGNLFALDPRPAQVSKPNIVSMFGHVARLIAIQLQGEAKRQEAHTTLLNERATSELREQFIAILGHDLRNPLQAIIASGEILERRIIDPPLLAMASRIRTNARRMSALIDDVLDFARGRLGGGIAVQVQHADNLDARFTSVVRELQDGRPDREILSNISVERTVRCDVRRLQQLASNLLGNALMHGEEHTPVKFTALADPDELVVEVWNAGNPIPPDSMEQIFSPFWRHSTSANREGLGLGLHICSQIVHAHHGRLTVTSSKEAGTLFTARIPRGS